MKPLSSMMIGIIAIAMIIASSQVNGAPHHFRTSNGIYEGDCQTEVCSVQGVPFAAPPVGSLRWRPPQPLSSFPSSVNSSFVDGLPVYQATAAPPSCRQLDPRYNPQSEGNLSTYPFLYLVV
jgi:hypothetical protein